MAVRARFFAYALLSAVACMGLAIACDDSSDTVKETPPGADGGPPPGTPPPNPTGLPDAGTLPDGAPADCYMNPTTHFEIINACTTAVKITKNPTLPLLYADGGLPPTP
ncbi:MAG TPA: hypothetical protein VIF62_14045 [Labilithrix sp.]|jgi:hypothetical protein